MSRATTDALIHVIDDDESVRRSLVFLLSTAGYAVRAYPSAEEFMKRVDTVQPGCIVCDVRMPGMTGLELLKSLDDRSADLPVVIVTGHGDVSLAVEAMKAGALDFLEKPFRDVELVTAVESALAGRTARDGLRRQDERTDALLARLSPRERQVLEGVLKGHPNKTIAYDLGISARTVEVHRANVMAKLEADSLPDLVRKTLSTGLAEAGR